MTTRRSGSPPRARGSRSSATSRSSASTRRPTSSPSSASATCPATCSATGCCCPSTSGSWPPTTTGTSSSTPTPDAATGFAERKRLFELPRSSWDDYDARADLRGRRRLPAHGEVDPALAAGPRGARASSEESLAPTDVIRAILRAPVDLLWNGGIGTRRQGLDRDRRRRRTTAPRDAIRVDANELRAKVVGEGGNLGFTRRARVEYAAGGGRINADFIDNSAGVDCSDHEVNLKILLGLAERRGELTRAERDELLFDGHRGRHRSTCSTTRFLQAQIIAQEVDRSRLAAVRLRGPDDAARGEQDPRPRVRGPADERGDRRAPARRARHGAPRAGDPRRLLQAAAGAGAGARRTSSRSRGWSATCASTSRPRSSSASATCSPTTRCARQLICMVNSNAGRQLARADVRVAADGRARRRAGRRRARVPDRPRGDRRRRALGGRRAARGRRQARRSSS